jgi:dihydrodipicolinate synthase/N-acetylneuraminate lyase
MTFTHPITKQNIPDFLVGVIAPMFTPADREGGIDYDGLREYTQWLVDNPYVTALFCRSGVGRMYSYTMQEAKKSFEIVLQIAAGGKPVFCGTSGEFNGDFEHPVDSEQYISQTIELSRFAQDNGATAAVLVIPAGMRPEPNESAHDAVFRFFQTVHDNTSIPIMVYNPQNLPAEYHTTPELVRRIAPLERIIGMKLSTNDMYWMGNLVEAGQRDNFIMVAGSECAYYQAIMTGAIGVIGQGCSVYPNILRRILDAIVDGDFEQARQAQFDVNRALQGFCSLPPDVSGFAYLRKKGVAVSPYCRDGSSPLDEEIVDTIFQAVEPFCRNYE